MSRKGSFSYLQDTINYVRVGENLHVRVARIDSNVARLYLVNDVCVEVPIPEGMVLQDGSGTPVPAFKGSFMITWVGSYRLVYDGVCVLALTNQKQQAITAPACALGGTMLP